MLTQNKYELVIDTAKDNFTKCCHSTSLKIGDIIFMKTNVGLWIDQRNAIIVSLTNDKVKTDRINSNIENDTLTDGATNKDSEDDIRDRRFTNYINKYYDEVIKFVRDAESIFIFGPGNAKTELKKRLEKEINNRQIIDIETVDNITDNQIIAKVREYYMLHDK